MKKVAAVCLFFALFYIGCDSGSSSTTIDFELGSDGFVQWYTDDPSYYDTHSWQLYSNNNGPDTFEIECKKISGNMANPYGMVFGASNSAADRYYFIAITVDGWFIIHKYIGNTDTVIEDWTESSSINTGYNTLNTIKVTRSGTTYTVSLNDDVVKVFTDNSITGGNRIGFFATVGPQGYESFPGTPVDVRFRQK